MKHWTKILTRLALLLIVSGTLSGCFKDDRSECPGTVYLRFNYTHNKPQTDLLRAQVEYLNLYFYDQAGALATTRRVLVSELDDQGGITLDIPGGDYTIVAWGNNEGDKFVMSDTDRLDAMRLSVMADSDGYISDLPGLFYGSESISIGSRNQVSETVSLIKNTNHIRVYLVDVTTRAAASDPLPDTDLRIRIRGCNWLYDYHNLLDPSSRGHFMEYKPSHTIAEGGYPQAEFDILRMFTDNSCQLVVSVEDTRLPESYAEEHPVKKMPLTERILSTVKDVNNDDDLNRFDDYEVRLEVAQAPDQTWSVVRIFINDWEVSEFLGGI